MLSWASQVMTLMLKPCLQSPSGEGWSGFRPGHRGSGTHTSELCMVELCLVFTSITEQTFQKQVSRWGLGCGMFT